MSEWISVEERLPEAEVDVLVTDDNGYVYVSRYHVGSISFWSAMKEVTHWMPLPAPPEENDDG